MPSGKTRTGAALYLVAARGHTACMQKQCPQCGVSFICEPEGHCWCGELPHLPLPADLQATSCLCRACLLEKIKAAEAARSCGSQSSAGQTTIPQGLKPN